ncbi:PEP carboxykinase N-terminal domain-containing protein, partial [Martensiomyces pterosporus]
MLLRPLQSSVHCAYQCRVAATPQLRALLFGVRSQHAQYSQACFKSQHGGGSHQQAEQAASAPESFISSLSRTGLSSHLAIQRNSAVARLYEDGLLYEPGTGLSSAGALIAHSGQKTGRSPRDKRIVEEASTVDDVWWGPVNKGLSESAFNTSYQTAIDYLNTRDRMYVFDGFAGWDPKYRIKVRVVCARAYHAL